ncbi:Hsp20 family protein [Alphaproteobacteria bacterium]|jgi:molecular chaperone IbpA|nr:Hsp20 family protein [Alphaproteobacteria bacterium]
MRTFDLTPLFRSSVGFDRLSQLMDTASRLDDGAASFPPYNIEKNGEDEYKITMAVAGFSIDDIEITAQEQNLIVRGSKQKENEDEDESVYLHRGIANRAFERRFQIAEHIRISGASMENGLLYIEMVREVPEYLKPRTIEIAGAKAGKAVKSKTIENQAA